MTVRAGRFADAELRQLELALDHLVSCAREQGRAAAGVNPVDPRHPTLAEATRLAGARAACHDARLAVLRWVATTHGKALVEGPDGARLAPTAHGRTDGGSDDDDARGQAGQPDPTQDPAPPDG